MDNNILVKLPKKNVESYLYKHHIDRIWDIIRNSKILPKLFKGVSDFQMIKGETVFEKGNIFSIKFSSVYIIYEVTSVVSKEDFKQIIWHCLHSSPIDIKYYYTFTLYKVTCNSNTLLFFELIFERDFFCTQEHKLMTEQERKNFLVLLDDYLNKNLNSLIQYESILIKSKKSIIWDIVSNWMEFRKLVPLIGDEIICKGDLQELGTEITVKFNEKGNYSLKVVEVSCEERMNNWSYTMECYEGSPKPPSQQINFTITQISEEIVFLEFKHTFLEMVNSDIIQSLSKDKLKILNELRSKIEKY